MSLAHRLKTTRKKHGLSQTELAQKVAVSQPTIANWERGGHIPRPDALSRIADVLNTDPAWLISGEMPARSNPAHQYLAKPIYHLPVYEWPQGAKDPTETQPTRYIAMATDDVNIFALDADSTSGFVEGTTLVFSRADTRRTGHFLVLTAEGYELKDETSFNDDVFARLIYSIVPH